MSERKQSLTSDQIVDREQDIGLPPAGVPNISNFKYDGASNTDVPNDVNDKVEGVDVLPAPSNLEVVSQVIKFAPDGTQYVTVVIEFDEVANAEGYQSRIAKV